MIPCSVTKIASFSLKSEAKSRKDFQVKLNNFLTLEIDFHQNFSKIND